MEYLVACICLQCRRPQFNSWVGKICWRRDRLPTPVFLGFPDGSDGKEPACNLGDLGLIPGLGRSPGEGKGYPLQYFGLENSMDYIVHGVTKSQTWLSNFNLICGLRDFSDCLHSRNSCVVSLLLGVSFSQIHTDAIEKDMVYSFWDKY